MDDSRLTIETPENVQLSYVLAGVGSRSIAALLDHLLILAGWLALLLIMILIMAAMGAARDALDIFTPGEYGQLEFNTEGYVLALYIVAWFVITVGYFLFFEARSNGQSPGKKVAGLRVVRDDGSPVAFPDVALRTFLRPIDFLPFGYFVAIIAAVASSHAKRLGDYAAGTVVIRLDREAAPAPFLLPQREGLEDLVASLRRAGVHRLAESEVEMAMAFLARRDQLDGPTRARLANEVAISLARRLGTECKEPEAFLEGLVLARHRRSGGGE